MRRSTSPRPRQRSWKRALRNALVCLLAIPVLLFGVIWLRYRVRSTPSPIQGQVLFRGAIYDREVRRTPRPLVLHFVTVDLSTPGLRFLVTPPEDPKAELPLKGRTTSAFLQQAGADLAINGDFFYPWKSNTMLDYYPHVGDPVTVQGYASSNGVPYGNNTKRWELPALCFSSDGKASIRAVKVGEKPPHNAVGGDRLLLQDGKVTGAAKASDALHPRTAAALDRSGKHLLLVIVDGRQAGYSEGATTEELALFLREKGAYTAINLDGGGSAALAVRGRNGMPEVLNSPINHWYLPHNERVVANHLGLFAPQKP
ncbi:MAG: phosphodiester glycosidase family protein [Armatimonadota bacterium]